MQALTDKNKQLLGEPELKAIEMKFEGYNMKEIAEATGMAHGTIREWFMTGGKLDETYKVYAKEEAITRRAQAQDMLKAHLGTATRTLVQIMSKSKHDPSRVQSAKEIMNRQLGEPLKIIVTDSEKVNEYLETIKHADQEALQRLDPFRENSSNGDSQG